MTEASATPDSPERCPACGARISREVDWCPRCYTSLVPPAPLPPVSAAPPAPAPQPADPTTGTELVAGTDTEPPAVQASVPPEAAALVTADRLLGELSARSLPVSRRWARRLSSTPVKIAVMLGGVVVVTGLLVGLMALLGLILPTGG